MADGLHRGLEVLESTALYLKCRMMISVGARNRRVFNSRKKRAIDL